MKRQYMVITFLWILYFSTVRGYTYDKGEVPDFKSCPGRYCGRHLEEKVNGNVSEIIWSKCGACPRGTRVNATKACAICQDTPTLYSWLYLAFMVITGLLLHWCSIDYFSAERALSWKTAMLHVTALTETLISGVFTLLVSEPVGSLQLTSCTVEKLSDWYTLMHNPNPNYEEVLHCSYEAVYPLYSIVFIYYGISLILTLCIRPWVIRVLKIKGNAGSRPIYAALYFIPVITVIHALVAGLIYYAFPFIVILVSVMSHAFHFASRTNQAWFELISGTLTSGRNLIIVIGHLLLHIYGLIALIIWTNPELPAVLLVAIPPLPAILYVAMVRFTDPEKLHMD